MLYAKLKNICYIVIIIVPHSYWPHISDLSINKCIY